MVPRIIVQYVFPGQVPVIDVSGLCSVGESWGMTPTIARGVVS